MDPEDLRKRTEKREGNKLRKRAQRVREKRVREELVRLATETEADRSYEREVNTQGKAQRLAAGKCFMGETSPGVDADTIQNALLVAREMARALGCSDPQDGESLYDYERRIWHAWVGYEGFRGHNDAGGNDPMAGGGGAPFLNRKTGQLLSGWGKDYWLDGGGFQTNWKSLDGAKEKLNIAMLPPLAPLAVLLEYAAPAPIKLEEPAPLNPYPDSLSPDTGGVGGRYTDNID